MTNCPYPVSIHQCTDSGDAAAFSLARHTPVHSTRSDVAKLQPASAAGKGAILTSVGWQVTLIPCGM